MDIASQTMPDGELLVREFLLTRNPLIKGRIVEAYAALIKKVAGRFNLSFSTTLAQEDLYQSGIYGLLKALDRYNLDTGVPFKAFAYKRIHGEIVDTMRREGLIGRDKYDQIKQLEQTIQKLTNELGMEPAPEEVCNRMGLSEDEYHALLGTSQLTYMVSLNTKISDDEGEFVYRIDQLRDEENLNPEEALEQDNLRAHLKLVINQLPDKQKVILALYFYEELTLADIGRVMNLTEARISQIISKTMVDIKTKLI
jgi:RNA polymerase sigma factor for flagellar operon FliA